MMQRLAPADEPQGKEVSKQALSPGVNASPAVRRQSTESRHQGAQPLGMGAGHPGAVSPLGWVLGIPGISAPVGRYWVFPDSQLVGGGLPAVTLGSSFCGVEVRGRLSAGGSAQ